MHLTANTQIGTNPVKTGVIRAVVTWLLPAILREIGNRQVPRRPPVFWKVILLPLPQPMRLWS